MMKTCWKWERMDFGVKGRAPGSWNTIVTMSLPMCRFLSNWWSQTETQKFITQPGQSPYGRKGRMSGISLQRVWHRLYISRIYKKDFDKQLVGKNSVSLISLSRSVQLNRDHCNYSFYSPTHLIGSIWMALCVSVNICWLYIFSFITDPRGISCCHGNNYCGSR